MTVAAVEPTGAGGATERASRWRYFWYAIAIAGLYSAIHVLARIAASPNLGEDDPLTNVLVQDLAWGYSIWQPPLFEWLAWGMQQVTGPTLLGFQLLKYALFVATVGALFLAAYQLTRDPVWSLITAEALTLIYHVGWRFHEGFTGIIPAMLCSALALLVVLRIIEKPRTLDFIILGFIFGLGLLSDHGFAIGIAAFLIAAAAEPKVRSQLMRLPLILTALIAAAIVVPYYLWVIETPQRIDQLSAARLIFDHPHPKYTVARVFKKTAWAPIGFFWSLLLFLLLASWGRVRDHLRKRLIPQIEWHGRPLHRFLGWYTIAVLALLLVTGISLSNVGYATHDLLAVMLPAHVLLFAVIAFVRPSAAEMRRWAVISLAILAFAFLARAANMFVMDPVCQICRWGVPFQALAAKLRASGFERGTIVTVEPDLGGNLRASFTDSRILLLQANRMSRPMAALDKTAKTIIVWQVGGRDGITEPNAKFLERLRTAGVSAPEVVYRAPWRHLFYETGYRHTEWHFVILN